MFYQARDVPVHDVLLLRSREQAMNYPRGDINLAVCSNCGFIANVSFDSALLEYDSEYEATQAYSPTFNAFHRQLAERLIDRYDLHDKDILEIGCGQGEFLILLCELGGNRGIGFDPAYVDGRLESDASDRITFVKDFYSEKYTHLNADLVCCKMTLEHIPDTARFVSTIRRAIGPNSDTAVFFQVPNVTRILRDLAFWDIYYEHCSYFDLGSLSYLLQKCGFEVLDTTEAYDNQYALVEARPSMNSSQPRFSQDHELLERSKRDAAFFSENYRRKLEEWDSRIGAIELNGQRAVIWGSGSKAVAFLTTLKIQHQIEFVVDINPHRHGTYLAGTELKIVPPDFLREYQPDVVIVMNPIYRDEIQRELNRIGLGRSYVIPVN